MLKSSKTTVPTRGEAVERSLIPVPSVVGDRVGRPATARANALVERAVKELMAKDRRPKPLPLAARTLPSKANGARADLRRPGEHDGAARVGLWKRAGAATGRDPPPAENDVFETSLEQSSCCSVRACEHRASGRVSGQNQGARLRQNNWKTSASPQLLCAQSDDSSPNPPTTVC